MGGALVMGALGAGLVYSPPAQAVPAHIPASSHVQTATHPHRTPTTPQNRSRQGTKGFDQTTFNDRHPQPKNSAGPLSSAPLVAHTSGSPTFVVNTTADDPTGNAADCASDSSTPCTLRDAVAAANAQVQAAVIQVPAGLYQLAYGTLTPDNAYGLLVESTDPAGANSTVVAIPEPSPSTSAMPNGFAPAPPSGSVSTPVVAVSDETASATGVDYTIDFTTSVTGGLSGGTITIAAPSGTVLPASGYTITDETNNSYSPTVASVARSNGGATAVLGLTGNVPAGQALELAISGVTNPSAVSPATITVATSADTTPATSIPYSVTASSGEVTAVTASPSPSTVNSTTADYAISFVPATALSGTTLPPDSVTVTAAPGTVFSGTATDYAGCSGSGCTPSNSFFSSAAPAMGPGSTTDNQVVLTLAASSSAAAGAPFEIDTQNSTPTGTATNPPVPSVSDTLSVLTSQDATPTWSPAYAITAATTGVSDVYIGTSSGQGTTEIDGLSIDGGVGTVSDGGGVYQSSSTGPVELDNDNFVDDSASGYGGGVYLDGLGYLAGDTFTSDTAGSDYGGGLWADSGSDVLVNNLTATFDSAPDAGGLGFDGIVTGSGLTANNDTASDEGGGVWLDTYDANISAVTADYDTAAYGGGISNDSYTTVLSNVAADHDAASSEGGGLYDDSYIETVSGGDFSNDTSESGGGIYIDVYDQTLSSVTADNDSVTSSGDGYGGGIYMYYANYLNWTNVNANGDSSDYIGGGLYVEYVAGSMTWNGGSAGGSAPSSAASCAGSFSDTAQYGGGMYIDEGDYPSPITLTNVSVSSDMAYEGGGIYTDLYYGGLTLQSDQISGNAACDSGDGYGGGIYSEYTIGSLTNTTVDHNYADYEGGGVYEYADSDNYGTFDMSGGSLSDNHAPADGGGALFTYGPAVLDGVTVDSNSAEYGGAIYNDGDGLQVQGGSVSSDVASYTSGGDGGGIYNDGIGAITGTTMSSDVANGDVGNDYGGAIYTDGDQLTLANDTLGGASAPEGDTADYGGGIYNDGSDTHVTGSTFSYDTSVDGDGGAIYNDYGLSMTNDTLAHNTVQTGSGGAIYNDDALDLTEVTIADNSASTGAGGLDNEDTANVGYSILSGDQAGGSPVECTGVAPSSGGYNVASDTTCNLQAQGDMQSTNPALQPLAENGGPTETMAILPTSPAVNVKVSSSCPTSTDQRGDVRPSNVNSVVGCDAGAYQLQQFASLPPGPYTSVKPTRICDTRSGNPSNLSGAAAQCEGERLSAQNPLSINVAGQFNVPSNATAAVLNVTAVNPAAPGYLTVYPAGQNAPTASNVNYVAGQTVPNLVEVGIGSSGQVSIISSQASDVVVDLEGYVSPTSQNGAGLYNPLSTPARICDTRSGNPSGLAGGAAQCVGKTVSAGTSLDVQVTGLGGVPPSGVSSVVLNVTAVNPSSAGFLTVYPQGNLVPIASNVNYVAGQTVPNRVIVPVSSTGEISVYSSATSDVVVDVSGWFSTSGGSGTEFNAEATPVRICDTRPNNPSGLSGAAAQCEGKTLSGGQTLTVQVTGLAGVPSTAQAVVLNVTAVGASQPTFLTVFPSGSPPDVSDLNPAQGKIEANMVVATLSSSGTINIYNSAGNVNVVVDVNGWYA